MIIELNASTKNTYLELILNCDPAVGDTACQIRAIILLNFYHQLHHTPTFNTLNQSEKNRIAKFIQESILLTTYQKVDQFIPQTNAIFSELTKEDFKKLKKIPELQDVLSEVTDENYSSYQFTRPQFEMIKQTISGISAIKKLNGKIDFFHLDVSQENVVMLNEYVQRSGEAEEIVRINQLKSFFQLKKQYLMNEGMNYLRDFSEDMLFQDEYQKYLHTPFQVHTFFKIGKKDEKCSIAPNYISTSIMLYQIQKNKRLLALNLKIFSSFQEDPVFVSIHYRGQEERFIIVEASIEDVALNIDMDIKLQTTCSSAVDDCFKASDVDAFLEGFKNLSIEKIILLCSAAHAVIPVSAKKDPVELDLDFPNIAYEGNRLENIDVNLGYCSRDNFIDFNALAKCYGLSPEIREPENAIMNIKHIYVGRACAHEHQHDTALQNLMAFR